MRQHGEAFLAFRACNRFQDYLLLLFDPGSPLRTTLGPIHPDFAQFRAGATHLLEDFSCPCLV